LEYLNKIRARFSMTYPYENLSILAGQAVSIKPTDLAAKMIGTQRGGYCFELNGLFKWALEQLGFEVKSYLGRVWLRDPQRIPPRNHGTNVVTFEGEPYLTDVGFGARAPRRIISLRDLDREIYDGDAEDEPIRIIRCAEFGFMVQRRIDNKWCNQFSFEESPAHQSDIEVANFFQSVSPNSHFRENLFAGLFTTDGRVGLFNNRLTHRRGSQVEIEIIRDQERLQKILSKEFNLDPSPFSALLSNICGSS
ncbi:MAG: arylamine N-acetyltransferase, partial [Cyanobacteria bacterium J06555_13]